MPLNRTTLPMQIELIDDGEGIALAEITNDRNPPMIARGFADPHHLPGVRPEDLFRDRIADPTRITVTASAKRHPNDRFNRNLGRNLAVVRALRKMADVFEADIPADCRDKDSRVRDLEAQLAEMKAWNVEMFEAMTEMERAVTPRDEMTTDEMLEHLATIPTPTDRRSRWARR